MCTVTLVLLLVGLLILTGAAKDSSKKDSPKNNYVLFVGTYTGKDSKGIYAYGFDPSNAALAPLDAAAKGLAAETTNPSYLAVDPSGRYLYAVNETQKYKGAASGAVSAFAINRDQNGRATDKLALLNQMASRGTDPCYIVFDKSGKHALVANYSSGSVAVFPVQADGRLGDASAVMQHTGSSINKERQQGPHAHWIDLAPDNRFAIAVDLGLDEVLVYRFDAKTGSLLPNDHPYAKVDAGAGPRHLAFHPNGKLAYVINELQSSITTFSFDAGNGELGKLETVSTLPKDFKGMSSAAEIKVHPNGKFLFASNRGHDSIAVFAIDSKSGLLKLVDYFPTGGKAPRDFEIDPTGKFLLVANQDSDNIVTFRIDADTGTLTPTGQTVHVSAPACLKFVAGK
jgi:6-phosphogluconolactonase